MLGNVDIDNSECLLHMKKRELKPTTAVVPCPVVLLSVRGEERPNIITLSWTANVCSDPPTVAVGVRPKRYSHRLMLEAGDFVLNIPSSRQFENVVFCGTKSGRDHDKFEECDFTPIPASRVSSPMIAECPINIECKTTRVIPLGAHDLFIAEVVAVHVDEEPFESMQESTQFDIARLNLFTYVPLTGEYWAVGDKMD